MTRTGEKRAVRRTKKEERERKDKEPKKPSFPCRSATPRSFSAPGLMHYGRHKNPPKVGASLSAGSSTVDRLLPHLFSYNPLGVFSAPPTGQTHPRGQSCSIPGPCERRHRNSLGRATPSVEDSIGFIFTEHRR